MMFIRNDCKVLVYVLDLLMKHVEITTEAIIPSLLSSFNTRTSHVISWTVNTGVLISVVSVVGGLVRYK